MADAVTTQVLFEDKNLYIVKLTNLSDGTGESAVAKVDVSALTPACRFVSINKISWVVTAMKVRLLWDATSDELILEIPENT